MPSSGAPDQSLADKLPRLKTVRVLCVGDLMQDHFVYGDVSRISPEAPIPVFRVLSELSMLGGAGNVARNITALGASVCFVAVVGDDQAGRDLTAMVGEETGVEPYLLVERDRPSSRHRHHGDRGRLTARRRSREPRARAQRRRRLWDRSASRARASRLR